MIGFRNWFAKNKETGMKPLHDTAAAPKPDLQAALQRANATCLRLGLAAEPMADPWRLIATFQDRVGTLRHRDEDLAAEVAMHLAYLADNAGIGIAALTDAKPRDVHRDVLLDTITNVEAVLSRIPTERPAAPQAAMVPEDVLAVIEKAEAQLEGWCSRQKSIALVNAILDLRPEVCVEIGVFGGRSAVPCAAALRHLGRGSLYAIESWSSTTAVAHATTSENDDWWSKVDFHPIKTKFLRFIVEHDMASQVRIVEAASARAAALFDQIDFLHIDGAHSVVNAAEDVILYAQKVRPGGVVIFDDVTWETTIPAFEIAKALCDPPTFVTDPVDPAKTFAILRRKSSANSGHKLKKHNRSSKG